jgi:hypothetical protein
MILQTPSGLNRGNISPNDVLYLSDVGWMTKALAI